MNYQLFDDPEINKIINTTRKQGKIIGATSEQNRIISILLYYNEKYPELNSLFEQIIEEIYTSN